MVAILDAVVVFIVSLLIGALGVYVGARAVAGVDDYRYAVITALIGAIAWALIGWIPLIGPLAALVAYIAVINYRYPGGWVKAIGIALIAWIAAVVVLYLLAVLGITAFDAMGVPGA